MLKALLKQTLDLIFLKLQNLLTHSHLKLQLLIYWSLKGHNQMYTAQKINK